jgi:FO synthase
MASHQTRDLLGRVLDQHRPTREEALSLADETDLGALLPVAALLRDRGHGNTVTYSRKVFIPLTHLCRDVCHYCTFAKAPRGTKAPFLAIEDVIEIARAGAAAGCKEALFTLGDKPELRYRAAREWLDAHGYATTLDYLRDAAERVLKETGLLPHLNPGLLTAEDLAALRPVAPSMGIMLESASDRLSERGMPHWGSPDKVPALRLETMRLAGEAQVPFTSGILIGIGETRLERVESLLALRDLNDAHGHIQEIIIQNFRAKPDTKMRAAPEPDLNELLWTIAVARIVFGPEMSIQAPPNLSPGVLARIVEAGIDDWGGVSPVTPDFVNPEAPWPHLDRLAAETATAGKLLVERLTIYPRFAVDGERWLDKGLRTKIIRAIDGEGFPRTDPWMPGEETDPPAADIALVARRLMARPSQPISEILVRAEAGQDLAEADIVRLFQARGEDFAAVCGAADRLREKMNGGRVSYVVNRNINYTNVCYFKCQFCAFSKGKLAENLRGTPYDIGLDEIVRRSQEAWGRGATEVCLQGGIHPDYTGETYLEICRAITTALPGMHVHAFSPLEVHQGAWTLGLSLQEFLLQLKEAGLGTLPGTAAEVLDDEVRAVLCPDKLTTNQWLEVIETAHEVGFKTTSTIMYGHIDGPKNWARHLIRLRDLQKRTGGITEFVPLPFVHMEAPLYLKGRARRGPTFREAILMHAVARLSLHPHITNIQASWVKLGPAGLEAALACGVNDLGGVLMNESITRAAGTLHGQEFAPPSMEMVIRKAGRSPTQRTTEYGTAPEDQARRSYQAPPLADMVNGMVERPRFDDPRRMYRPGLAAHVVEAAE